MADFLDAEAEESSESEQEESRNEIAKKRRAAAMEDSEEEEEDDDEDRLREELKDLIDDGSPEESERESDADVGAKKKRRKSQSADYDDRLEDDDYDLIEENLGITVQRKKRFKRLRRVQEIDSDEEREPEEERDAIANQLFDGSGDEDEQRSVAVERAEPQAFSEVVNSDADVSEADDFIVDDDGRPVAEKRHKRRTHLGDAALQEAQDIFGVDFDYEEFDKYGEEADEEDEDDEEEEDEDLVEDEPRRRPKKTRKKRGAKKTIFDVYEPSELKRGHFTDVDNEIRNADLPERMQLRTIAVRPVADGSSELSDEADWIYKYAFCRSSLSIQDAHLSAEAKERARKGPATIGKIKKALDFMRNQNFEVPFISFYRKEYVSPELNINDLWRVYKWDAKWCELSDRKSSLEALMRRTRDRQIDEIMKKPDAPLPEDIRLLSDGDLERVRSVETPEELNDLHHHFRLYYSNDATGINRSEDIPKPATRTGPYALCRRAGLESFAKRFGLSPEQYGENLRDNYQRHEIEQEPIDALELALDYRSEQFAKPEDIVKAATLMVAIQLAREPLVRKTVREIYTERAKITVRPTPRGVKEIDENHSIYALKYLKEKPVKEFVGEDYLKLAIAERDKLVTIVLSDNVEGATSDDYLAEMKQLYHRDEFSKIVQAWNALRAEAVELAYRRMLLPDLRKELISALMAESKDYVLRSCARKMYNWLKIGPYAASVGANSTEEWDEPSLEKETTCLSVMGLAYVPDQTQAAFACIVSPDGECTDHLRLANLLRRRNSPRDEDKTKKEADLEAIKKFLRTRKPNVIAIGGESREATMIRDDIKECVASLVLEDNFTDIPIEICENEIAKIYANGTRGTEEFRDYPTLLRQAISIARRLQDPLVEFSQLCGPDDEILCVNCHPRQDELSRDELLETLRLEFVNRVNEVGVDLNASVQRENRSYLVQFVCGLGARKAQGLLKLLKRTNKRIENRTQLVTICHMGPKVFINCAGFVRIDTNSLGDGTDAYVEVLDGTRIHPETYEWARKMAVDALEYDDNEDANPADALNEIFETPDRLKDLDLDAFAEELERQGFGDKSITLYDIRAELNSRYKDLRAPYESPGPEKLFNILTKETPESFYIGKLVTAIVTSMNRRKPEGEQLDQANPVRNDTTGLWQCPFCLKNDYSELSDVWNHFDAGTCPGKAIGVRLRLDNGVSGYIHVRNISDKHVENPEDRVRPGQVVHCRVIKIEVDRFSVECSSKGSDLADKNNEWRPQRDVYYDTEAEERDARAEDEAKRSKQRLAYVKRVIVHSSFHNVSYAEAAKLLEPMKQGETIVRPSSKGSDRLTVTWKVTDQVLHHIDVREDGKNHVFSLGKRLFIGDEEFEDLDEIIARHVNPMAAYASELMEAHYYKPEIDGLEDKADQLMKEQKKENPGRIPCVLSASKKYPGKFLLSYLPRERSVHEYISVSPNGVRYRGRTFARVGELFSWFRKHFRDPRPVVAPKTATLYTPSGPTDGSQEAKDDLDHHTLSMSLAGGTPSQYSLRTAATVAGSQYGSTCPNTPYTPSARTPYMTPGSGASYSSQPTPGYGQATPGNNDASNFLRPGPPVNGWPRATQFSTTPRSNDFSSWQGTPDGRSRGWNDGRPRGRGDRGRGGRGGRGGGRGGRGRGTPNQRFDSPRSNWSSVPRTGNETPLWDEKSSDNRVGSFANGNTPLWDESESWDNEDGAVASRAKSTSNATPVGNRSPLWDESESWDEPETVTKKSVENPSRNDRRADSRPQSSVPPSIGNRSPLWDESESWDEPEPVTKPPRNDPRADSRPPSSVPPSIGNRSPLWDESESWDDPEPVKKPPRGDPRADSRPPSSVPPSIGNRSPLWDESESWDEPEPVTKKSVKNPPRNDPRADSRPPSSVPPSIGNRSPLWDESESWDDPEPVKKPPRGDPRADSRPPSSVPPSIGNRSPLWDESESWDEPESVTKKSVKNPPLNDPRADSRPPSSAPPSIGNRSPLWEESESWDDPEPATIAAKPASSDKASGRQSALPVGSRTPLYEPSESWDSDGEAGSLGSKETSSKNSDAGRSVRTVISLGSETKSSYPVPRTNHISRSNIRPAGSRTPLYAPSDNWDGWSRRPSGRSRGQRGSRGRPTYQNFRARPPRNPPPPPPISEKTFPDPPKKGGERSPLYDESESWD